MDLLKAVSSTTTGMEILKNPEVVFHVAAGGHLSVLDWLLCVTDGGFSDHKAQACAGASAGGQLELLKPLLLQLQHDNKCTESTFSSAAQFNQLHILKWAHENNYDLGSVICANSAAQAGHVQILQWLHTNNYPWNANQCGNTASLRGHLTVLQWIHTSGFNLCTSSTVELAARGGHIPVLEWLQHSKAVALPWNPLTCARAAEGGHLETLLWLRKNNCSWNGLVCDAAAFGGYLHVLQWAHANGCDWHYDSVLENAKHNNHKHIVEWLLTKDSLP
ncbi:hypothetical protein H0W32_02950 [Patescibacteria group bacterium]|nr:hypothetical protein [Patescibacteria group bacterium]